MSNVTEKQKQNYLTDRRKWNERFFSMPLYKRFFQKIERLNKHITFGLLGKILRVKRVDGKLSIDTLSSILIIRQDALGDMIVTSPLWRILKMRKPSLTIGVAGSFRNLELLRADTGIDHLYNFALPTKALRKTEFAKSRSVGYDLVIACKFDQKTRGAILARKASQHGYSAMIVPDNGEAHHKIISKTVTLPPSEKPMQMILQLQYLLENTIDLHISVDERRPTLIIEPKTLQETKARIDSILARTNTKRYVVINTESATEFREWGYENNYFLAKGIIEARPDTLVFLTSSPLREEALKQFLARINTLPNILYSPTPDMHELATLIRFCSLVVSPDTSVIHFASAEQKSTIGFYIHENPWLPFRVPAKIFIPKQGSPATSIPFQPVFDATLQLLDTASAKSEEMNIYYCE